MNSIKSNLISIYQIKADQSNLFISAFTHDNIINNNFIECWNYLTGEFVSKIESNCNYFLT